VEPDVRYYRRRANEELAAANRAVTEAARQRRMQLATSFLERLRAMEAEALLTEASLPHCAEANDASAFDWREASRVHA